MSKSDSKKRLSTLRDLVDNLTNRDVKAKRDMNLFEDFFKNFPIPVTIWAVSTEGTVVSQRGNGLVCKDAECLNTLFFESEEKGECIQAHQSALAGNPVQKLISSNSKMFYMSVIPRRNEDEEISGVLGLAWDVTPNYEMLNSFEEIVEETKKKEPSLKKIKSAALKSLKISRLAKLIKSTKK